jgi:hypothetical protein
MPANEEDLIYYLGTPALSPLTAQTVEIRRGVHPSGDRHSTVRQQNANERERCLRNAHSRTMR